MRVYLNGRGNHEIDWRLKAMKTRLYHARGYRLHPLVLQSQYGWDLDIMADDAAYAFLRGFCSVCRRDFVDAGALSLDIIIVTNPPYYSVNTRWICSRCNSAKGRESRDRPFAPPTLQLTLPW